MEYYENIRRLRREQNLTQQQLADKLQVSRQTVVRWENGWTVPNFLSAQKMAQLFGVDVGELMTGEEGARQSVRSPERASVVWFSALCAVSALLFRLLCGLLAEFHAALCSLFLCGFTLLAVWWGLKLYRLFSAEETPYARLLDYRVWRWGCGFFGASLCAVLFGAFWESRFVAEIECFAIPFLGVFCYVFCDTFLKIMLRRQIVAEKNPLRWCDCVFLIISVATLTAFAVLAGIFGGRSAMIYAVVFCILLGVFGCGYLLFRTLFLCFRSRKRE